MLKKVFYTAVLILGAKLSFAQPPLPDPISGCWPPPCVPIDGGISFLLIAGAAYGGKKIYENRKKNTSINND